MLFNFYQQSIKKFKILNEFIERSVYVFDKCKIFRGENINNNNSTSKKIIPYLFIFPALFFVVGILGYAVFKAFIMSLQRVDIYTIGRPFVGLDIYIELFQNPRFHHSVQRSLIFVVASLILGIIISMAYALSLYKIKFMKGTFRGISLIPFMVSGVAAAIMWRFMFSGNVGVIPLFIKSISDVDISWLGHENRALIVLILANIWYITPFPVLILLSGLQSIDKNLFDAAIVDGASKIQQLKYITLPLLKPQIGVALIFINFVSFNMFSIVLPLTGGGPARATELFAVLLYRFGFEHFNMSYASAIMIILLLINSIVSLLILKLTKV